MSNHPLFFYTFYSSVNNRDLIMNRNILKKRLHYIKASSMPIRAKNTSFSKRDINHIKQDSHPNEEFRSFFDYEDDLSSLKPSNQLVLENENNTENKKSKLEPILFSEGIEMEEIESAKDAESSSESVNNIIIDDNVAEEKLASENNDKFFEMSDSTCIYYLSNGKRCENKKEGSSLFCIAHQQL